MRQSVGGAPVFLLLATCVSLGCRVAGHDDDERHSGEITLDRNQIFVEFENVTAFSLLMEPNDSARDLYDDLYELEGVPWTRISVQSGDVRLDLDARLSDQNIRAGSTVTLNIREARDRYTTELIVRTRDGRKLPVATSLGSTVANLKDNITQWTGIAQAEQRLLLGGRELRDGRKLALYGIYNRTIIDLGGSLEECRRVVSISVKTLSGATSELEVNLASTVANLKERIWEREGVPVGAQHLLHGKRAITGEDHLCDLGLDAGSIVYMLLYSTRLTSLDQVARLREQPAISLGNAPIFREAEQARRSTPLLKDARNWITRGSRRPDWSLALFDPAARLAPDPDYEEWVQYYQQTLAYRTRLGASESERLETVITIARFKFSSAVGPYRAAANIHSGRNPRQQPGITLGGRFPGASSAQQVPLGADANNWAPDAFSDSDVMRLFEVSERVRRLLARAAHTGEGLLSVASQRRINRGILFAYLAALAGYSPSVECQQAGANEECAICMDGLTCEPAVELVCEHAFHADCIQSWAADLYDQERIPTCPFCRQRFMFPYEALGKAELEASELRDMSSVARN